ncbi:MAG TPA: alkaline phosphatase family protein [Terriglobales bacterium]
MTSKHRLFAFLLLLLCSIPALTQDRGNHGAFHKKTQHVLLISLDGFHQFELERYIASHPGSALAELASRGVQYSNAITTRPSDSFPASLAMVTGGSPSSTGVFYDVSWDDNLSAPGSDCSTRGTVLPFNETIDFNPNAVVTSINPALLPRDPDNGCAPFFPHSMVKVNNIFEVIKAHGGRTAMMDKHPSYELYQGPSGNGVDDLYTPEANPVKTNVALTEANDELKVQAILHQIDGFDHTGTVNVGVPTIFGMNFQTPNVAQKNLAVAYTNANGDISAGLQAAYDYVDGALQRIVSELRNQGLLDSTLVIITAKHANGPVDPALHVLIKPAIYTTLIESVQPGLTAQVTTDTAALIWLKDHSRTADVLSVLQANAAAIGAETFYAGDSLRSAFNGELNSSFANREPDIIVQPRLGVIYSNKAKNVEHGGFHEDDIHVPLMISQPGIEAHVISDPVETKQIAPTILKELGLKTKELQAVQLEGTQRLPELRDDDELDQD